MGLLVIIASTLSKFLFGNWTVDGSFPCLPSFGYCGHAELQLQVFDLGLAGNVAKHLNQFRLRNLPLECSIEPVTLNKSIEIVGTSLWMFRRPPVQNLPVMLCIEVRIRL